jgi:hypothetical protein
MKIRAALLVHIAAVGLACLGLIVAAPARPTPSDAFCNVQVEPDCWFVFTVNQNAFPVAADERDLVIAKGEQACAEMSAYTGPRPVWHWATQKVSQVGGSANQTAMRMAVIFAGAAAKAYCPSALRD